MYFGGFMDARKLETALDSWLREETWHTPHALDEKRFHRALKAAFDEVGLRITAADLREAIRNVLKKRHPEHLCSMLVPIERYAQRGEEISAYLTDQI
jgi:hypothetical protein